jgi:Fe-S cluster assembly protein SufD
VRERAAREVTELALPTASEELWRYSPINDLELDQFTLVEEPGAATLTQSLLSQLTETPACVISLVDGFASSVDIADGIGGLTVTTNGEAAGDFQPLPSAARSHLDALHDLHAPSPVVISIERGSQLAGPIVIVSELARDRGLSAPWVHVHLGVGAEAQVAELIIGGGETLTVSTTELTVADGAHLRHAAVQLADGKAWHLAHQLATVGRDATLESFSVGLGAAYDRVHTEVTITAPGGTSKLRSLYLGTDHQVHDVRTVQDHAAPHTISDLLCKGAVAESSTSVFTGTIAVRNGAVRSDAVQSNHNLVLGDHASAESVPNLDIHENDVRCAHGSTVGPVDEEQRYYLESRGIAPQVAERLLVTGFFDDALDALPVTSVATLVRTRLKEQLAVTLTGESAHG